MSSPCDEGSVIRLLHAMKGVSSNMASLCVYTFCMCVAVCNTNLHLHLSLAPFWLNQTPIISSCMCWNPTTYVMQMPAKTDKERDDLQAILASIVSQTPPDAQHAVYHARHLELLVHTLEGHPAR